MNEQTQLMKQLIRSNFTPTHTGAVALVCAAFDAEIAATRHETGPEDHPRLLLAATQRVVAVIASYEKAWNELHEDHARAEATAATAK